jgi:membrane-associated protein
VTPLNQGVTCYKCFEIQLDLFKIYKGAILEDLLLQAQQIASQNITLAPWVIFGLLLLAGLNIPVSEDGMLLITAILAFNNPDHLVPLFLAVYLGAYFSDIICYTLGRTLGPKLFKISFFKSMMSQKRMDEINRFYEKHGILTLIFGRFIPFGVRNGLFLTAGLGKMNFTKFALSDLLACTISCSAFFSLYYKFGKEITGVIKQGNIILFSGAALFAVYYFFIKKKKKPE